MGSCNRFHIETARSSELHNVKYCAKDGDYYTFNILVPKPIKTLKTDQLYDWQKIIIDIINEEPDDRAIYWFKDDNGKTGKTTFCKYLCLMHGAIMLSGKSADMKNAIVEYNKTNLTTPFYFFFFGGRNNYAEA